VSHKEATFFDDQILPFAARDRRESVDDVRFVDFVWFGYEHSVELLHDNTFRRAQRGDVL